MAHPPPPASSSASLPGSVLAAGALARLAVAGVAVVLLWAGVAWAIAQP